LNADDDVLLLKILGFNLQFCEKHRGRIRVEGHVRRVLLRPRADHQTSIAFLVCTTRHLTVKTSQLRRRLIDLTVSSNLSSVLRSDSPADLFIQVSISNDLELKT
jgi:hypothetical protein